MGRHVVMLSLIFILLSGGCLLVNPTHRDKAAMNGASGTRQSAAGGQQIISRRERLLYARLRGFISFEVFSMDALNTFLLVLLVFAAIIVLVTVLKTLFTVRTYTAGVVERFGKFNRIVRPGLHLLIPYAERVFFVDLQVKQAQFQVETKTRDNVFVQIPVSVQYQVLDDKIYDAFYKLSAPQKQIESFVFNSILGHVPKLTLDETFEQQSGISINVKTELDTIMSGFGFNILTALVTDIIPDVKVKTAMNDINAAQRAQVAAQARGEAEKILKVKQAEAEAESKALLGKGIAAERQAIIDGLRASIENFRESVPGSTAEDVMALVLLTQYFDTLRDIGTRGGSSTIFLPNSPGAANDFMTQILAGLRANVVPART
jgi:regulator of protease activity HflC (stomatin/prohibitin superfamily)